MYRRLVLLFHRPWRRINISQHPASASTVVPPTRRLCKEYRSISSSGAPHSLAAHLIHAKASALLLPSTTLCDSWRCRFDWTHLRPLRSAIAPTTGHRSGSPDRNNIIVSFVLVLSLYHVIDTDMGWPFPPSHSTPSPTHSTKSFISSALPGAPHISPPRSRKKNPKTIPPQMIMLVPLKLELARDIIARIIGIETGFQGREWSNCLRPPFSTKERKGLSVTNSQC